MANVFGPPEQLTHLAASADGTVIFLLSGGSIQRPTSTRYMGPETEYDVSIQTFVRNGDTFSKGVMPLVPFNRKSQEIAASANGSILITRSIEGATILAPAIDMSQLSLAHQELLHDIYTQVSSNSTKLGTVINLSAEPEDQISVWNSLPPAIKDRLALARDRFIVNASGVSTDDPLSRAIGLGDVHAVTKALSSRPVTTNDLQRAQRLLERSREQDMKKKKEQADRLRAIIDMLSLGS
jgi:hypothetical protein